MAVPITHDLDRLDAARATYAALRARVLAGGPWALAAQFGTEPEASWGPREVLAHVAEMLPYWLGELERILDEGGDSVPFGRIADDPVRIGIIGRDRTLPLRVLFDRVDAGLDAWARRLPTLTDAERAASGRHPKLGKLPVGDILERFVLGHVEDHARQLAATLDARGDVAAGSG